MSELKVLYLDDHMVAIHKPSGMVVHPSQGVGFYRNCMKLIRDHLGQIVYPVNRLDRGTSGVLVMGLSSEAASVMAGAFRNRQVEKTYVALVRGWTQDEGTVEEPLDDKPALTRYRTLSRMEVDLPSPPHPTSRYSFVRAQPRTGIYHQLRRHLRRTGHPVIGDRQHGSKLHNRAFHERFGVKRLLLHSYRLILPHPVTGEPLQIVARLPGRLRGLFQAVGTPREVVEDPFAGPTFLTERVCGHSSEPGGDLQEGPFPA
ncbi:MAG: hypothetical protein HY319_03970 [Armatimonadetes bacterium]|nr:hypothetical protein [Armatimonadota bacterium]